jgi:RNA polymerase sigma-70 factor (ECF subfamily)
MTSDPNRTQTTTENDGWRRRLAPGAPGRDEAIGELHRLLLGGARSEGNRRRPTLPDVVGAELDDLCHQAADDALTNILAKLDTFRGDSRFTTWAYKFAIFEISTRLRRHAWRGRRVELEDSAWERIESSDDFSTAQQRRVLAIVREAMADLTERQRLVFQAAVLQEVPIDVLAERFDTTRGAIYKVLHDARRKLRERVEVSGYGEYLP